MIKNSELVVIDLQKGILEGASLEPFSKSEVLLNTNKLISVFNENVTCVNVDTSYFKYLGPNQDSTRDVVTKVSDEFLEIMIDNVKCCNIITKFSPSAFFETRLDSYLRHRNIDTLVICGVITSLGVYSTVLDAYSRGYKIIVISDACSDRDKEVHNVFINKVILKLATVMTTKDFINNLDKF